MHHASGPGPRLNPIGRNGTRLLCRHCRSDAHLIRDCPTAPKIGLVRYVCDTAEQGDVLNTTPGDMLDFFQDMNDEEYDVFLASVESSPAPKTDKPSEALLSTIAHSASVYQAFPSSKNPLYESSSFEGVMLENGAAKSPSRYAAHLRYCNHSGVEPFLRPSSTQFSGIGSGLQKSMGLATVRMPLSSSFFMTFEVDVIEQDVPLIFGFDLHHRHNCRSNEVSHTFTRHLFGITVPVVYKRGHLYIEWPCTEVLLSLPELKHLHERFSHPTTTALMNLLRRADPKLFEPDTKKLLDDISASCKACQTHSPKPIRFKVSLPQDELSLQS